MNCFIEHRMSPQARTTSLPMVLFLLSPCSESVLHTTSTGYNWTDWVALSSLLCNAGSSKSPPEIRRLFSNPSMLVAYEYAQVHARCSKQNGWSYIRFHLQVSQPFAHRDTGHSKGQEKTAFTFPEVRVNDASAMRCRLDLYRLT